MRNLLSAGGARLRKNKLFWILLLFMFGMGAYIAGAQYMDSIRYQEKVFFDSCLFNYVAIIGCCTAVFCSMFTGTEYSDGTIRNKLLVGHSRKSIYGSELMISIFAAFLMDLAYLLSYGILGMILFPSSELSTGILLFFMLLTLFTSMAFVSLYHMLTMLIGKKSVAAVVCLLVFFALFMMAVVIMGKLQAPEFVSGYSLTLNGVEQTAPEPNPKYLQPAARRVYQFFYDLLPSGQGIQLASREVLNPVQLMIYAATVSVVTTVSGIVVFGKKDLK